MPLSLFLSAYIELWPPNIFLPGTELSLNKRTAYFKYQQYVTILILLSLLLKISVHALTHNLNIVKLHQKLLTERSVKCNYIQPA